MNAEIECSSLRHLELLQEQCPACDCDSVKPRGNDEAPSKEEILLAVNLLRAPAVRRVVRQVRHQIRRTEDSESSTAAQSGGLTEADLEANNTRRDTTIENRVARTWVRRRLVSLQQRIRRKLGAHKYKDKTYNADLHVQGYSSATNTVVVVAALIATLSFAALLAPPGGIHGDEDGRHGIAKLAGKQAFQVFYVANGMALFVSLLTILILTSVVPRSHNEARVLYEQGKVLVWIATMLTVLSFSSAAYIVAGPAHRMLAWIMFVGAGATMLSLFGTVAAVSVKRRIKKLRSNRRKAEQMSQQLQGKGVLKVRPWSRSRFVAGVFPAVSPATGAELPR